MNIYLIGKTEPRLYPEREGWTSAMPGKASGSEFERRSRSQYSNQGQELIEFAGRLCYESFDLPNPKTATNSGYIQNIISLGHESVLEHASVTFYVEGVSRNLSHELIRHRHLSFSELSQRYVNMEDANQVAPPAYREVSNIAAVRPLKEEYREKYLYNVEALQNDYGYSRKQAREAARSGLPGATETKFVVSGNLRAWRDVLKKRLSVHADAEMQLFAREIHGILFREYADVFADIDYETE
ncbi:MAG TPA: FAD-dependent thymidylate synthase [Candidatus Paceibacterota bacterium]